MTTTVNPNDNAQGGLTAVCAVMLALATTAVFLRIWSVYADSGRKFGLDDFFVIASLVGINSH